MKVNNEDADLHLSRVLYPILLMGLENLASQVEKMQTEPDSRVRERFNACAYLAEYLMRNNPKYNPDKGKELIALYTTYSNKEKMNRILINRKILLRSIFTKLAQEDNNFVAQINAFIESLDNDLKLTEKISSAVNIEELTASDVTSFDEFWDRFVISMSDQDKITGNELEEALESKYPSYKK